MASPFFGQPSVSESLGAPFSKGAVLGFCLSNKTIPVYLHSKKEVLLLSYQTNELKKEQKNSRATLPTFSTLTETISTSPVTQIHYTNIFRFLQD